MGGGSVVGNVVVVVVLNVDVLLDVSGDVGTFTSGVEELAITEELLTSGRLVDIVDDVFPTIPTAPGFVHECTHSEITRNMWN